MNTKFWSNKTVLITGFEGFLGSNLTKALVFLGSKVIGLDILTHRKSTILSASDYHKIKVIKGSVTDHKLLKYAFNKYKVNYVFHLAAQAIVGDCYDDPLRNFSANIEGTWKVLEACRAARHINGIIMASSDKAYGNHKQLPYLEKIPLSGKNPYDVSKSCADLIAQSYYHSYGLPVAITRCGNIYGPGDFHFSRLVPDAIRCALTDKTLLIRSNGKFTRDYIYVDDIVNGYISLAEKLNKSGLQGEAFNFSNGDPLSVIDLVKKIYRFAKKTPQYKILDQAKHEIPHQYLDSRKARKILGWKPRVDISEGLGLAIKWYKNIFHQDGHCF